MKFDLVRPCPQCPFRTDVPLYLRLPRVREILNAITEQQQTFSCHKTLSMRANVQHCAGALIMLERINRPNQMMRVAERINLYDRTKLEMGSPVYESPAAMRKAYGARA